MADTEKLDLLNINYDQLNNENKLNLVLVGENLLNIQNIINQEKESNTKMENSDFKNKIDI